MTTPIAPAELPFLIVHGAWVWKVALVVLVALTLLGRHLARWAWCRRGQRRAEREVLARAASTGLPVWRGRLRGWARTIWQPWSSMSDRSDAVAIELADGSVVAVAGPVEVMYGTRTTRWWFRAPSWLPRAIDDQGVEREVVDGDEVVAVGETTGATAAASPVRVVATRARPRRTGLLALVVMMGLSAGGWFLALGAAGESLDVDFSVRFAVSMVEERRVQVAASLPGARERVLDELRRRSHSRDGGGWEVSESEHVLALRGLFGTCRHDVYARALRFDEAVAEAGRCASVDEQRLLLVRAGRYREARALVGGDSMNARLMASAGDRAWEELATLLDDVTGGACLARHVRAYATGLSAREAVASIDCDVGATMDRDGVARTWLSQSPASRAGVALIAGRHEGARAMIENEVAIDDESRPWLELDLRRRAPSLSIGDPRWMPRFDDSAKDGLIGDGDDLCRPYAEVAVAFAEAGEGRFLAHVLPRCGSFGRPEALAGATHRVRTGRVELAEAVRTSRDLLPTGSLFEYVNAVSWWRDISAQLGDADEAARMQAVVARHAAAFEDERVVVALRAIAALSRR